MYTIIFRRFNDDTLYTLGTFHVVKVVQKIVIALAGRPDVATVSVLGAGGVQVIGV